MKKFIITGLVLAPTLAFAQTLGNLETLLRSIQRLVSIAMPIIAGLALLGFFWGLVQYIFSAGDDTKKEKGQQHMIWGVIGLFVMMSVFGIMQLIINTLGVTGINPRG